MGSGSFVITCEHGGNEIPKAYRYLFKGCENILNSHRGWDPGALELATRLAGKSDSQLFYSEISRLLVEANRSVDNEQLFSEFSDPLSKSVKKYVLQKYYYPYRDQVESYIGTKTADGQVVHLSVHTFTPVLDGETRLTDIGLLYDESRPSEHEICQIWLNSLSQLLPDLRIELNKPYLGTDDGFTGYLRKKFPDDRYCGIEIEVNQKFCRERGKLEEMGECLFKMMQTNK